MAINKARLISGLLGVDSYLALDSDSVNTSYSKSTSATGTMDVYSSIDILPTSAAVGTKALVTSTNTLYIYNSGWYKIAIINNFNPQWITQPNSTYDLAINGTATSITVVASDSDDVPITYTAVTDSDFDLIATVTHDSDKHNVWTVVPLDSENGAATGGTGTITFKASDGVNLVSALSTFSLTFGPDWSVTPTESILRASDAQASDRFGDATAISGDGTYAIVGAYGEDQEGGGAGAAYIFERSGSTWTEIEKLTASDAQAGDGFGRSLSINSDGTYAIVGAPDEDTGGGNAGAAYIFTRSGSTWTEQQKILSSDIQATDQLGVSVSMSSDGTYAIVGATGEDGGSGDPISDAGAAYVFTRSGSTWTEQAILRASDAQATDRFGNSVSINSDGSYIIVGSSLEDTGGSAAGAAYIFTRSGSTWTQQQKIQSSDIQAGDSFGHSVSMNQDGTYVIVAARVESGVLPTAGAAYIYTRSGSTWTQQQKIQSSDIQAADQFGYLVSISGDGSHVVVSTVLEDGGPGDPLAAAGAAYIFSRSGSTWTEIRKLTSSDLQYNDRFGGGLSISSDGSYVIVGAFNEDGGAGDPLTDAGAAYIYEAG